MIETIAVSVLAKLIALPITVGIIAIIIGIINLVHQRKARRKAP